MLQEKGMLLLNPTQNIDNLEEKTGMDMRQVIQAHGANRGAHCAKCKHPFDQKVLEQAISESKGVIYCEQPGCKDKKRPIKPNIVFFGEQLPTEFLAILNPTGLMSKADLLIVMGTALAVAPFSYLIQMVPKGCLKVLMNLDNTNETGGYDFTEPDTDKLFIRGKCDETVAQLCHEVGWTDDFEKVLPAYHAGKHLPPKI